VGRSVRFLILGLFIILVLPLSRLLAQEEGGLIGELKLFSKAISVICEAYPGDVIPETCSIKL